MPVDLHSLWTVEEVARFLSVQPKTVYQWASACLIPKVKIGRAIRFKEESIRAWVESNEEAPVSSKTRRPVGRPRTRHEGATLKNLVQMVVEADE